MTYLAKICRTTHIAMNIRAKPPIIPKRVGSTYDPTDISRDFESASKNEIKFLCLNNVNERNLYQNIGLIRAQVTLIEIRNSHLIE